MKNILIGRLKRFEFWPFVLFFTSFAIVSLVLLMIAESHWITGESITENLMVVGLMVPVIFILFLIVASLIQSLKDKEEGFVLLEHALDKFSEAYYLVEESGRIRSVNETASKALGYSEEELTHMKVIDIDPDFLEEDWSQHFEEMKKSTNVIFEARHKRKDGSIFPVEIAMDHVQYQGKSYLLGFVRDITERQAAQQKEKLQEDIMIAQSRNAAMGEMISMIAHQWRQPLSMISMGASSALVDIDLDEMDEVRLKKQLEKIIKQSKHLSQTIDDFRDFFRPDKVTEEVSIDEVMTAAIKIIGKSLENHGISISVEDKSSRRIKTYARELLQVYINLINNASDAFLINKVEDAKIEASIYDEDDRIMTTVCDNAGGIDKEIMNKIFDPYFSTKESLNGTGLGLYMSKTIIEKHLQGNISVQNKRDGVCFQISIPYVPLEVDDR